MLTRSREMIDRNLSPVMIGNPHVEQIKEAAPGLKGKRDHGLANECLRWSVVFFGHAFLLFVLVPIVLVDTTRSGAAFPAHDRRRCFRPNDRAWRSSVRQRRSLDDANRRHTPADLCYTL